MVAPRSISAWFQSPARPRGSTRSASLQSRLARAAEPRAPRTRKTRASTRAMFVSTAAASAPNAMLATAPAVYRPMPGRRRSATGSAGETPSCRRAPRVAGARVVAETRPAVAHRVRRCRRQVFKGRIAAEEAGVVPHHPGHLRLLKHELRDEDLVGIAGSAPRQRAPVQGVPPEQTPPEGARALRKRKRFGFPPRTPSVYTLHRCAGCAASCSIPPPAP